MASSPSSSLQLRQQIEAIQDATLDGIFTVDRQGVILSANDRAVELFDLGLDQLLGLQVAALMPPEDKKRELEYLEKHGISLIARGVGQTFDVRGMRGSKDEFPFRLAIRQVGHGEAAYCLCVVHDLSTVHKGQDLILELHEELREKQSGLESMVASRTAQLTESLNDLAVANKKLAQEVLEREAIALDLQKRETQLERLLSKERELNELRSRFVSMASHEFRTPLTTMLSSVEIIEMSTKSPTQTMQKHTRRIREGIGYLRNVLEDFLQLGKLDVRGTDLHVQEVDLPDILTRLTEDLQLMCKPGQDIELNLSEDVGTTLQSVNALRIAITNLVTNAIKYSPEASAIDVDVKRHDDQLLVSIADEGIGIPKAELPYLFERFFRASNAETIKGTGLGLHIVSRYVKAAGGTIEAEANKPRGTVFNIAVPYALELSEPSAKSSKSK